MQPPWVKYPELEKGSIGWRMGYGEDYYNRFYQRFSALDTKARDQYQTANPEPPEWRGIYKIIADHPWLSNSN